MCARTREHPAWTCQSEAPFWFGDRSIAERRSLRPPGYFIDPGPGNRTGHFFWSAAITSSIMGLQGLASRADRNHDPVITFPRHHSLGYTFSKTWHCAHKWGTNVYRIFNGKAVPTKAVWAGSR
jgi:hypothetical protein